MGSTPFPPVAPPAGGTPNLPVPGQPSDSKAPSLQSAAQPNLVSFGINSVGAPSSLYVQRDDQLVIDMTSAGPADTVTITARLLEAAPDLPGQPDSPGSMPGNVPPRFTQTIKTLLFVVGPSGSGFSQVQKLVALSEGYLLSVVAVSTNASNDRGFSFVRAYINRGPLSPIDAGATFLLFSDYVAFQRPIGWPGGRQLFSTEGPGAISNVNVTNPAAGADWIFTVPNGNRLRVMTMEAQIAVANSGAARPIEFIIDDGLNILARMATNVAASINATSFVNFSNAGTPSTSIATDLYAQLPSGLLLNPGWRIRSVTTNIVAGDQWSAIWFAFERWVLGG